MDRTFAVAGALLAFAAVALGAFGTHALADRLSPSDMEIFETAVRYHLAHAVGLLGVAWAWSRWPVGGVAMSGWLIMAGILIFSGSLYLLVLTDTRWLGAVTPVGGVALLLGWASLAWAIVRAAP
jgi:uncharacterized membrane protein YgdD (TMEM256/DUF423 family)